MKKILVLAILLITFKINAQVQRCGTIENLEEMQKLHPELIQKMEELEIYTQDWLKNNTNSKRYFAKEFTESSGKNLKSNSKSLCAYDNSYFTSIAAPSVINQIVSPSPNCTYGGEYVRVYGLVAGNIYMISTCATNTFDTQITIYPEGGGSAVAHNDDWCGAQSLITFNPLWSGNYDILIDEYNCQHNTTCSSLEVELIYTPRPVVTVPVVVHVVNNGESIGSGTNISDAQIFSQMDVLNNDFRRNNTDIVNTPAAFLGISDDALIEFCLAQQDENGFPTNGIERINGGQLNWTRTAFELNIKPYTIWDRDKYLNLWTCDFGGVDASLCGYSQFPGLPASTDGVTIRYKYFGTVGNVVPPFQYGKTAVHEIGHWFNLQHIWGDQSGCSTDDEVDDTPLQDVPTSSICPSYPITDACSVNYPGIMFYNNMDYSADACLTMFTFGQAARMESALFGLRASLLSSNGCQPSTVGVSSNKFLDKVIFSPNPSNGIIDFDFKNIIDIKIQIYNILGDKIYESQIEENQRSINLASQPNGIYFVKLISNNATVTKKIIIEK